MIIRILQDADSEIRYAIKPGEIKVCCPFCVEMGLSEDEKFHLGINTRSGAAHCYRCNWKSVGLLNTAKRLAKGLGVVQPLARYRQRDDEGDTQDKPKNKTPKQPTNTYQLPAEYEKLIGNKDIIARKARKYLENRNISTLQIIRHKMGIGTWGNLTWRIIFPVIGDDLDVYGHVARAILNSQEPKYLNSTGTKILWNAYKKTRVAIVCEGIMDALSVERALLTSVSDAVAVARLGSTITEHQLAQLKKYEEVVILPDWDKPGCQGAIYFGDACNAAGITTKVFVPPVMNDKDPGDMSPSEIIDCINSSVRYNKAVGLKLRLASCKEEE